MEFFKKNSWCPYFHCPGGTLESDVVSMTPIAFLYLIQKQPGAYFYSWVTGPHSTSQQTKQSPPGAVVLKPILGAADPLSGLRTAVDPPPLSGK